MTLVPCGTNRTRVMSRSGHCKSGPFCFFCRLLRFPPKKFGARIASEPVSPRAANPAAEPAQAPAIVSETYHSDNLPSGAGADFSPWYTLCSDNKPDGWTVADSTFELKGDRAGCAWAECKQTQNTPTKVCWQFRMQGHSEQVGFGHGGNTGIQNSQGFLKVVWKH